MDVKPIGQGDTERFEASIDVRPGWDQHYRHWTRRWASPSPESLEIVDDYELVAGTGVAFHWLTTLPVEITEDTVTITGRRGTATIAVPENCGVTMDSFDHPLRGTINRCTGRVVVVRPIDDIMAVPRRYLARIPPDNLQTLGVGVGADRLRRFAVEAGARGVTALRGLGRAAFPKIAYSWDGLLPYDLGNVRPAGHFTTVETEDPLGEIAGG